MFATGVIVGEYYLYVWFVTENVFGYATGKDDSLRYALMVSYAIVVYGLWRAVMQSIEKYK